MQFFTAFLGSGSFRSHPQHSKQLMMIAFDRVSLVRSSGIFLAVTVTSPPEGYPCKSIIRPYLFGDMAIATDSIKSKPVFR